MWQLFEEAFPDFDLAGFNTWIKDATVDDILQGPPKPFNSEKDEDVGQSMADVFVRSEMSGEIELVPGKHGLTPDDLSIPEASNGSDGAAASSSTMHLHNEQSTTKKPSVPSTKQQGKRKSASPEQIPAGGEDTVGRLLVGTREDGTSSVPGKQNRVHGSKGNKVQRRRRRGAQRANLQGERKHPGLEPGNCSAQSGATRD